MANDCTCADCVAACRRVPGIFHPTEALRAIRAGYAARIMASWRGGEYKRGQKRPESFLVLSPWSHWPDYMRVTLTGIRKPSHIRNDAFDCHGRCTFLKNERCEIHASGFKPAECRSALLCKKHGDRPIMTDDQCFGPWDTPVGRRVIQIWKRERSTLMEKKR